MLPLALAQRAAPLSVVLCALIALLAPTASAAAPSRAAAEQALGEAREALRERRDLSLALRDLATRAPALGARDRREAGAILARPTDDPAGDDDAAAGAEYRVEEAPPLCSDRFCVHFVRETEDAPDGADDDGDGSPNYVERVLQVLGEVHDRETGPAPAGLAWPTAPPDGDLGGGGNGQVDVYLADIAVGGMYGYVVQDPGQQGKSQYSYMVLDNDYADEGFAGDESLRVAAAHEYNHVLQNGIDMTVDAWVFEAGATWMEEQVYPDVNDYFQYLEPWASGTGTPLTSFIGNSASPQFNFHYGSAVWNFYLESRFGDDVMRDYWTRAVVNEDALTSYDRVIPLGAGTSFAEAFGGFAAAVAEWRSAPARFPDNGSYPDATRAGALAIGAEPSRRSIDHASFQLLDVTGGGGEPVRLEAAFRADLPGAIALVGRPPGGGAVVERVVDVPEGGAATVVLENPAAYERVTAVLVNADRRYDGYDRRNAEWYWTGDDEPVTARAVVAPGGDARPPVTTIDAGPQGTTDSPAARFLFSADEPSAFTCRLDAGPYVPCSSPATYGNLGLGEHRFEVRATDAAGNVDASPASRRFTVVPRQLPPPPPRDTAAPSLRVKVLGKVRRRKLRLRVTCPATEQSCAGRVTLKARVRGRRVTLGTARVKSLRGGSSRRVTVRVKRSVARRLRGKLVTARASVRVTDAAGNVGTQTVRLRVRG